MAFPRFTHTTRLAKLIKSAAATVAKTKELKKRSWGACQERIVFVRFGSRLPCERHSFQPFPIHFVPSYARAVITKGTPKWEGCLHFTALLTAVVPPTIEWSPGFARFGNRAHLNAQLGLPA